MNSTADTTFNIQDVPHLFSKYWRWIFWSTLICTAFALVASSYVPKKYKAHFILTIYSKYFQSPLIGDLVPGLSESNEMRSQRESLIRQILTPEYLDTLGHRYNIYSTGSGSKFSVWIHQWLETLGLIEPPNPESILSAERESLRQRIEIYSVNNTTFMVGFLYSDPDVTLKVTQDIYAQVTGSLLDVRRRIIDNVRNAVQSRLGSLPVPRPVVAPVPSNSVEEQSPEQELMEVRRELRNLTSQYTDIHPLVMQMRDRERLLMNRIGHSPSRERGDSSGVGSGSNDAGRDVYGDLTKKLNYLDIAIDSDKRLQGDFFAVLETPLYPSAPLWPKKGLLVVWGFALGFFGSLFIAALKEFFDRSALHAHSVAHQLGVPLLGDLPAFPSKATHS